MVAINTSGNKLRRVQSSGVSANFQSQGSVPSAAFQSTDGGAALARALGQTGDTLGRLALQMQEEDNETEAKAADSRIAERIRRITMGDPSDPQAAPGFLTTQGKTTLDSFGPAEEAARAALAEELERANANPQLAGMIQQRAQRRLDVALDRMVGHTSDQRLAHQQKTSEAREAQALADVSADWKSNEVLGDALKDVQAEVLDRSEAQGLSDEATEALLAQRQSVIVKGAFDAALVSQDVARAQAIFSANADRLDGPTRTTMAQALAADAQASAAQSLATEAWEQFRGNPTQGRAYIREAVDGKAESAAIEQFNAFVRETRGDRQYALSMQAAMREQQSATRDERAQGIVEQAQLELGPEATAAQVRDWIRQNSSGKDERAAIDEFDERQRQEAADVSQDRAEERYRNSVESEARAAYNHQQTVAAKEDKKRRDNARKSVYDAIYSGATVQEWRQQNPQLFDTLAENNDVERALATQRAHREGKLYADASDGETLNNLLQLPSPELAEVSLKEQQQLLTEEENAKLTTAVLGARRRQEADAKDRPLYNSGTAALTEFAPPKFDGFKPTGSRTSKQIAQRAKSAMDAWITLRLESGEGKPTPPEIREQAAVIMTEVETNEGILTNDWEGIVATSGGLTPEQRATVTTPIDKIPDPVMEQINQTFIRRGINPADVDKDIIEQIGGAIVTSDRDRLDKLLNDLQGLKTEPPPEGNPAVRG